MIVKNEAPVIERCLSSIVAMIDYWIIVDTGSSDGTQNLVRSFFARAGVPGELHERPWRDFAANRSEALELARHYGDYSLVIDADDTIEVPEGYAWPELTADGYMLRIIDPPITYERTQLMSNALPWRYRGVLHEFPVADGARPVALLDGPLMHRNHDGARRREPLTYGRDAAVLEAALLSETDPMLRTRYTYYLGQSYRDAGEPAKAAEAYGRRVEMGGWEEERWSAKLHQARNLLAAGDAEGFVEAATTAFSMRPQRAEPLLDLARHLRSKDEHEQAMLFAELASHIGWPTGDRLFIEDAAYGWGIQQEIAISGFYAPDPARRTLGRFACNALALDRTVPADVRGQARQNLAFYARRAAELMPSWQPRRIPFEPEPGWHALNPSVAKLDGALRVIVRTVNFDISNGVDYIVPDGGPVRTRNFLYSVDSDLNLTAGAEILPPAHFPAPRFGLVLGFEDLRLFGWQGGLWCTAAIREMTTQGWYEVLRARLDSGNDTVRLAEWQLLAPEAERRHEKNWMPRVVGDELQFIYSSDPVRIVDADGRTVRETVPAAALEHLRGGSQAIPFDGGWLALTHEVVLLDKKRNYLHRFVWLDSEDNLTQLSEAFIFHARGLEFAAGLAWHPDAERLMVSFGAGDAEAWLATVSAADIRSAIAVSGGK